MGLAVACCLGRIWCNKTSFVVTQDLRLLNCTASESQTMARNCSTGCLGQLNVAFCHNTATRYGAAKKWECEQGQVLDHKAAAWSAFEDKPPQKAVQHATVHVLVRNRARRACQ